MIRATSLAVAFATAISYAPLTYSQVLIAGDGGDILVAGAGDSIGPYRTLLGPSDILTLVFAADCNVPQFLAKETVVPLYGRGVILNVTAKVSALDGDGLYEDSLVVDLQTPGSTPFVSWKIAGLGSESLVVINVEAIDGQGVCLLDVPTLTTDANGQTVATGKAGFGDRRKAMLEDIAVLTGGEPIEPVD